MLFLVQTCPHKCLTVNVMDILPLNWCDARVLERNLHSFAFAPVLMQLVPIYLISFPFLDWDLKCTEGCNKLRRVSSVIRHRITFGF